MWKPYHAIDRQQLVAPLQASLATGHAPRDHSGNVDGGVLLFAPHDVETQALFRLWKLHHSWVGVALAGCKSCHRGLASRAASASDGQKVEHSIQRTSEVNERALPRCTGEGRNMTDTDTHL